MVTVRVVFANHHAKKYHPKRFPLPTLYLHQNLICPPASRLYLKVLLNILQTVSSCSRYTTFSSFVLEVASIDKTYLYPNVLRSDLRTNLIVLMRTSRKTHFRL